MNSRIYLDHNATTPLDERVLEEMLPWLRTGHGNASSIHSWGVEARTAVERARRLVARAINAKPDEVVFTSGGTESINLAVRGLATEAFRRGERLRLLSSNADHAAVRETVRDVAGVFGFEVLDLPVTSEGRLEAEQVRRQLGQGPVLLATLAANNEIGCVNDVKTLCEGSPANTLFVSHIDAVQALGRIPVDVAAWGCDTAAFSAHKIYGPKGIGALYIRKGTRLSPLQTGGGQEGRLRPGTENVAGIVGFGAAVRIAMEELETEARRQGALRDALWRQLSERIPEAIRNTAVEGALPGTLNVSFPGHDGRAIVRQLDELDIAISAASACSSGGSTVSHVLVAITDDEERQRGAVRISLGRFTGELEIRRVVEGLARVLGAG